VAQTGIDAARVQVLGPVRVTGPEGVVDVPGVNGKALIVSLVLARGAVVSVASLVDDIWQDDPPRNARAALQTLVSRVRASCGDDLIESLAGGYRLGTDAVDLWLAGAARRGEPGADLGDTELAARLRETADGMRVRALEERVADALSSGAPDDAVSAAQALAAAAPYDERAQAQLMRSLAAAGRHGEALRAFADFRQRLDDELGARPGAELVALNAELLQQEDAPRPAAAPRPSGLHIGIRAAPNALIGRDADIAALESLMATSRLTTILGPGGLGKTRLAQELARRAAQRTPGVVVVELAGIRENDDVPLAVAAAFGIGEVGSARVSLRDPIMLLEVRTRIRAALSERETLLVLDNCEHVIEGAAYLVDQVLSEIPSVRVLATSRSPLQLTAESVYPLGSLAAADRGPAVELFMERARAARPGAALPLDAVARLCEHLDGLPLAIELAAARIRSMSVDEIERRLGNRFALLRGGDRSAPERHRTLIAVIDWSWNLLSESERRMLRRLSRFVDGFSAGAADAVADADADAGADAGESRLAPAGSARSASAAREPAESSLSASHADDLDALVLQSLVSVAETPAGLRYRMLETVREFGDMALVDAGEDALVASAQAGWARAFSLDFLAALPTSRQSEAIRALGAEHDNLVVVLRAAGEAEDAATAVPVFAALLFHWLIRNQFREALSFAPLVAGFAAGDELPADAPDATAVTLLFATIMGIAGSRMPQPGDPRLERSPAADMPPELSQFAGIPPMSLLRAGVRAGIRMRRLVRSGAVAPWLAGIIELLIGAAREQHLAETRLTTLIESDDEALRVIGNVFSSFLVENLGELETAERHALAAWEGAVRLGLDWMAGQAARSMAQLVSQEDRPAETLEWIERGTERLTAIGAVEDISQSDWIAAINRLKLGRRDGVAEAFDRFAHDEEGDDFDGFDMRAIGWTGFAELAAADGRTDEAVESYRAAVGVFGGARPGRPALGGWYLISGAAALAASVYFDRRDAAGLELARGIRINARVAMRGRSGPRSGPESMDRPVSATAGLGIAIWLLGMPDATGAQQAAAAELLALAERMHSRQDLPVLVRERAVALAERTAGASTLAEARARVAALPGLEACAARLDELLRVTRF